MLESNWVKNVWMEHLVWLDSASMNIFLGECPDGHKEGDTWPPMGGYCEGCSCFANGWGCGS